MKSIGERDSERRVEVAAQCETARPRRTAESIAREAYRSSRIEECAVEYSSLLQEAQRRKSDAEEQNLFEN